MRTRSHRPTPGSQRGTPCPYTTEFDTEICGEPATTKVAAVSLFLCDAHASIIQAQFVGAAGALASVCPECYQDRDECICAAISEVTVEGLPDDE